MPEDELVPRALRVEHRRVQLTAGLQAGSTYEVVGNAPFEVAELLHAERVREATGRVDGQDERLGSELGSGAEGGGGRGRRLPDATRTTEDHDLARRQERLERSRRRGHANPSSWDKASASMRVTRKP